MSFWWNFVDVINGIKSHTVAHRPARPPWPTAASQPLRARFREPGAEDLSSYVAELRPKLRKPQAPPKRPLLALQDVTALLSSVSHRWRTVLGVYDELMEQGVELNLFGASVVVQSLGRVRQWARALRLLKDVEPDLPLYSSAMKACGMDVQRLVELARAPRNELICLRIWLFHVISIEFY